MQETVEVCKTSLSLSKNKPKVSVVIPAYNAETFLAETLESVLAQTYPNMDVIVVNDGSRDATPDIVAACMARHPNLRMLSIPNGGVANARNAGTAAAEDALFVAYCDADDLWHPTKVEKQVARMLAPPDAGAAACYAWFRLIDADGVVLGNGDRHHVEGHIFLQHLLTNHVGCGSSLLVRRDVALEIGFDPSHAARGIGGTEDYDFQLAIAARYTLRVVPEYLVGYRRYDGNMSSNATAMGGGYLAVIRRHIRREGVPWRIRTLAMSRALLYACLLFARARSWPRLRAELGQTVREQGLAPLVPLSYYAVPIVLRRATRFLNRMRRRVRPQAALRTFDDFDATDGA